MEITEKELIEIINEEIKDMIESDDIDENVLDRLKAQGAGLAARLNPFGDKGDADVRAAASLMKSYDAKLLRLSQKMQADAQKLGIEDSKELQDIVSAMQAARGEVRQMALAAPRTMRDKAVDARRAAAQAKLKGAQPTATPSVSPAPTVTTPSAVTPAPQPADNKPVIKQVKGKEIATSGGRQLSQDPRNVKRREKRAAAKAAAEKERERKDRRNAQARARRAKAKASAAALSKAPAQAAAGMNESEVKKGETLNEQLQEISKRWGFDK